MPNTDALRVRKESAIWRRRMRRGPGPRFSHSPPPGLLRRRGKGVSCERMANRPRLGTIGHFRATGITGIARRAGSCR